MSLIYNAGYEGCFGHSLGHSVGIEIHEMPGFSPSIAPETTAKEGMVITVEPGIYLEGRFGVRIEDMVWLAPDGTKDLTNSPKEPHYPVKNPCIYAPVYVKIR